MHAYGGDKQRAPARRGGAVLTLTLTRARTRTLILTQTLPYPQPHLREEEELRGERHPLDEDGRREAAAAWLGSGLGEG